MAFCKADRDHYRLLGTGGRELCGDRARDPARLIVRFECSNHEFLAAIEKPC